MYRIFHVCKIGRESGLAHNRRSTDNWCRTFVFDESKIFVKDSGREGILVFDKGSGNLLKRVNPFGEGPEEIKRISSFCLDTYHKRYVF